VVLSAQGCGLLLRSTEAQPIIRADLRKKKPRRQLNSNVAKSLSESNRPSPSTSGYLGELDKIDADT
jgi:hypothetical protein